MANRVRGNDYSGQPFGRPRGHLIKGWRVKYLGAAVTAYLNGQDSITASAMLPGLQVYCGYVAGTYNNYAAVTADHPGALYIGIAPWVAPTDCLDIEPGDAAPADAPSFYHQATHPNTNKPVMYTSAGDAQTVINALAVAGIARSAYYLWSAHYGLGPHVCGPSSCGFPQADGTQWTDGANYDSDLFASYMFGAIPAPVNPTLPLKYGDMDATATGPVHAVQANLNKWAAEIRLTPKLTVDGDFGAATLAAVKLALTYWHYSAAGVALGEVDQSLYDHLASSPVPPAPVKVAVPQCTGKTAGNAHNALVAAKLVPTAVASQTPGMICSGTSPAAGTSVDSGTRVTINAGDAPLLTENITGYVSWVRILQADLNKDGAGLTEDGNFGALTLRAVETFQYRYGLTDDGEVGPATWAKLGSL